ncbi:SDR family NAD(P)-dependent oxidoreductase [Nonomuraea endophytica]|uniref:SDR family NAD(P)-dependent oxidoreductase n=1 Tax=Nonomuraea endophytica TaxID=714136 RepID=UPI0037CB4FA0
MIPGLLAGKTVLLTGAGRGIGLALGRGCLAAGATVLALDRGPVPEAGFAHTLRIDLAEAEAAARARDWLAGLGVSPDIVINNAAVSDQRPLAEVTAEQWQSIMNVNLRAPQLLARELVPLMTGGSIVNITSIRALRGFAGDSVYQASKGGLETLTKALAVELAPRGIRVNAIAPGAIATELNRAVLADPAYREQALGLIPLGRFGGVDDVVGAALYLGSDLAGFVTGSTLVIDGGQSIRG